MRTAALALLGAVIGFVVPMLHGSTYASGATVVFTAVQVDDRPSTPSEARAVAVRMTTWAKVAGSGDVAAEAGLDTGETIAAHEISGVNGLVVTLTSPTRVGLADRATAAARTVVAEVTRGEVPAGAAVSRVSGLVVEPGSEPENVAASWAWWGAALGAVIGALLGWLVFALVRPSGWMAVRANGPFARVGFGFLELRGGSRSFREKGRARGGWIRQNATRGDSQFGTGGDGQLDTGWDTRLGMAWGRHQARGGHLRAGGDRHLGADQFASNVEVELRRLLRSRRALVGMLVAAVGVGGYAVTGSVWPPFLATVVAAVAAVGLVPAVGPVAARRDPRWIALAVLGLGATVLPDKLDLVKIGPITPTVLEFAVVVGVVATWRRRPVGARGSRVSGLVPKSGSAPEPAAGNAPEIEPGSAPRIGLGSVPETRSGGALEPEPGSASEFEPGSASEFEPGNASEFERSVFGWPLLGLVVAVAVGCVWGLVNGGDGPGVADTARAILLVPLVFVVVQRAFVGRLPQLVALTVVGASVASAVEIVAAVVGAQRLLFDERTSVITGTDTSEVSRLASPVLPLWGPLLVLLVSGAFPMRPRWRLVLLAVPGVVHEALSFNRSTWAPLLAFAVVVAVARFGTRGVVKRLVAAVLLGTLALGLAGVGAFGSTGEALAGRVTSVLTGNALAEDSLADRQRENVAALETLRRHPVMGIGVGVPYGGEIVSYDNLHDRTEVEARPWIHNQYLRMWLWFGVFGLVMVGLLMVRVASVVVHSWRTPTGVLVVALGLGLACLALQSVMQTTLIDRPTLTVVALVLAMMALAVRWRPLSVAVPVPLRTGR